MSVGAAGTGAVAALGTTCGNRFGLGAAARADHAGARQQLAQLGALTRRASRRAIGGHERFELPAAPAAFVLKQGHDGGFYQRCPGLCTRAGAPPLWTGHMSRATDYAAPHLLEFTSWRTGSSQKATRSTRPA